MSRRDATSVVSPRTGAQGGGVVIESLETSAHEEVFSANNLDTPAKVAVALRRLQERIRDDSRGARTLPVNGGTYWTGQTLTAGEVFTYAHGVKGVAAFIPCNIRATANAAPIITQVGQTTDGRIQLATSANCVADLWFYPQPGLTTLGGAIGTPATKFPPFAPTGAFTPSIGVLGITGGPGIGITGGITGATGAQENPIIYNTGVLGVTGGPNIVITGTSQNPIISATGVVLGITGGSGIGITGTAQNPIIYANINTGVLGITGGSGIGITGTSQNPIIYNTGVLGVTSGSGIVITGTSQNPIISANNSTVFGRDIAANTSTTQNVVAVTGVTGILPCHAANVVFDSGLAPVITANPPAVNVFAQSMTIQAPSSNTSSTANVVGGSLILSSGYANNQAQQTYINIVGSDTTLNGVGAVQLRTSGLGGVPNDPSAGHFPFRWSIVGLTIVSGSATPLTTAQSSQPWLQVQAVSLGGTGTIITFPNTAGFWLLDLSQVTFGAFGITLQSGTASSSLITATQVTAFNQLVIVVTTGSNGIRTLT